MDKVKDDDKSIPHDKSDEKGLAKSEQPEKDHDLETPTELHKMPPEVRRSFESVIASFQSGMGMPLSPLFNKFTEAHIDKFLDYIQRDDDHEHELRRWDRVYYLIYFILGVIVLGAAIVYLLPKDRDFLVSIITFIIIAAGGLGAGYGISKR